MAFSRTRQVLLGLGAALLATGSSHARAQESGRALLRQLYGDVAVVVHSAPAAAVRVGADDGKKSVTITLLARDLRRWADSASKILAARPARRGASARWRAIAEGPGVAAGSMTLSRSIAEGDTTITFFVADPEFESIRVDIAAEEARALVRAMRRVANTVLTPPRRGGGVPTTSPSRRPPGHSP
jgi:hypothetical protein